MNGSTCVYKQFVNNIRCYFVKTLPMCSLDASIEVNQRRFNENLIRENEYNCNKNRN